MPISGQEAVLTAALVSAIESAIAVKCGAFPISPKCIDGLAEGIANAIIPFLVANTQVNSGQAVTTTSVVAVAPHPPGGPAAGTGVGVGATSAPGTIS